MPLSHPSPSTQHQQNVIRIPDRVTVAVGELFLPPRRNALAHTSHACGGCQFLARVVQFQLQLQFNCMHARPLRIQQRSTTAAALVFLNDTLHVAQILPSSQYWTVAPLANHALLPQSVCVRAHLDRNICACWLAAARCPPRDTKGTVEPTCDLHVLDLAKGGLLRQPSCASTRPCWTCPPPPASTANNWESPGQINVDAPRHDSLYCLSFRR